MAQLAFANVAGFVDIPDTAIAADQPLTDDSIQKVSHNAKFGAVRCEVIFMGFYANGNTIVAPTSPVDGYSYALGECLFSWSMFSSRAPASGFVAGQKTKPNEASGNTGAGQLFHFNWDINDATGAVSMTTSYFVGGGAETVTNDGIMKVYAFCQRSSVNAAN